MRNKFLRFCQRLRGGADPDDDISDDDTYTDRPIVVPKHKRGREIKSSMLSKKAVEAVRQMSLSTKHYDPLNIHSDHASVVEEYHKGYSNDQMYLVPDSTLRTMKNIVNYQFKKPQTTYYVGGQNPDLLPQPTIFDNIKMSLDSVMLKIEGLGDDESSDSTTTSGSDTSDSSAIDVPEFYNKEEKEEQKPEQQAEEQNENVNPENELVKQIAESKMPETSSSESSDSGETFSETEIGEASKESDNMQVLKHELVPGNLIRQAVLKTDIDLPNADTDHPKADTYHPEVETDYSEADTVLPEADKYYPKADTDLLKTGTDYLKSYTDQAKADTDNQKSDTIGPKADIGPPKPVIYQQRSDTGYHKTDKVYSKKVHDKQYFVIEGKFEKNFKPLFAIKKCNLTNEVLTNSTISEKDYKQIIFTKKHIKKVYLDIEGQFAHKDMPDNKKEYTYENRIDDTASMNENEFAINAQRFCHDNSEIKINITGHLIRQENSMSYVPVLIIKLRNKSSKINNEPQLQPRQNTADIPVSNQSIPQFHEQNRNVNKQLSPKHETMQVLPANYQTMPILGNEVSNNVINPLLNQRLQIFQSGPLINYQAMPVLINGPGSDMNKQQIHLRKEIGQGLVNNQIVPVLTTGECNNKQRERIRYRAVNSQVMPVFQMPIFQVPIIELMHLPQSQYHTVILPQQPAENASQYLNSQITEAANIRLMPGNAFSQGEDNVNQGQNPYSSRVQNSSSPEASAVLFSGTEFPGKTNVEQVKAEKETTPSTNEESVKKNVKPSKKLKTNYGKKEESSDKARPMDTGGAGNKINIVNNPIVGQLEEFFIGHVHIPQVHLHGDTFEPLHLKKTKISLEDILKIRNTAGYLLRSDLHQLSESYSSETSSFEKTILKTQTDIENFFLKTENVESLILLPTAISKCKIHYTEMHLQTHFEESYIKITLQHTIVVVFCNGHLWFVALENTNSSYLQKRKVTLQQYFKHFGIDKSDAKVKCVTQKDLSRRKFSDDDLRKLIEKLSTCANTAEICGNRNLVSITTSSSQLSNTLFTQNKIWNIYWDVINCLK